MNSGLDIKEIISAEKNSFHQLFGIKSLVLYGSYARKTQHPGSDIDFMYEMEAGRQANDFKKTAKSRTADKIITEHRKSRTGK